MKRTHLRPNTCRAKQFLSQLFALLIGSSLTTQAATLRWTGAHPTSSEWSRPANWDLGAAPQDGDTLVFPSGAARLNNVNNIADLDLVAIRFSGNAGGYNLSGNGVTVTNSITATNSAGINTITLNRIILGKELPFNAAQPGSTLVIESEVRLNGNNLQSAGTGELQLLGIVQGRGDLIKSNTGKLILGGNGANTFTGDTVVEEGTLELNKSSGLAVPGMLIVGDGLGGPGSDLARNTAPDQVNKVTVKSSGLWDLGNFDEEVSELTLEAGGDAQTGPTGHLRLGIGADVHVAASFAGIPNSSSISGNLDLLLGNHDFIIGEGFGGLSDSTELIVDAHINGLGALTKKGAGDMSLSGNNTFIGLVKVEEGELRIDSAAALGQTLSGTQVLNQGTLQLRNNITIQDEALTLNSTGTTGVLNSRPALSSAGNNVWDGTVLLDQDSRIDVGTSSSLDISGIISGSFGITKEGTGNLRLSGGNPNTFTGDVLVNSGTLELDKGTIGTTAIPGKLVIGDGLGTAQSDIARQFKSGQVSDVIINGSGLWDLNGNEEEVHHLELNQGGDIQTGNAGKLILGIGADLVVTPSTSQPRDISNIQGHMELLLGNHEFHITDGDAPSEVNDSPELVISADIDGLGAMTQSGNGDLELSGGNNFAGKMTVEGGELRVTNGQALGSTLSGTWIENDAVLRLSSLAIAAEPLHLNSTGQINGLKKPTLLAIGTVLWIGPIELAQTARIGNLAGDELLINGAITGTGGLIKEGQGLVRFGGGQANTYSGTTKVLEGSLLLDRLIPPPNASIPHRLEIGSDLSGAPAATVICIGQRQISQSAPVHVATSGTWQTEYDSIAALSGNGSVRCTLLLETGLNGQDSLFSGVISGQGILVKRGQGLFTLSGNNTYQGFTSIGEGSLELNGKIESSILGAFPGCKILGEGKCHDLLIYPSASLDPGKNTATAVFKTDDLTFLPGSRLHMELHGTNPGAERDLIQATGTVSLGNSQLDAVLSFVPTAGQGYVLIENDGNDPVIDTFNGLPEGAVLRLNNLPFHITYQGGDGNDVALTYDDTALSLENISVSADFGNGNQQIEAGECNGLTIQLRNERNIPLIITRAILDSLTPGVVVTSQESSYLPFEPLGTRPNTKPYQISTARDFECGRPIRLQLTLTLPGNITFALPIELPSGTPGTAVRFDQPSNLNITDNALSVSTLNVQNASPYIGKISVGLHITHSAAGDLVLRLRSPQGTTVRLVTQAGGALNDFGTTCSPISQRTVFDDGASTKIATATPPFVGAFVPEDALSSFVGEDPNGIWQLLINDVVIGDTGTLECWSLDISPAECSAQTAGTCESCTTTITGKYSNSSPTTSTQLTSSGDASICGIPNTCPGSRTTAPIRYEIHTLSQLVSTPQCITVAVSGACTNGSGQIRAAAYAGSFNPADPCQNYLGDSGGAPFTKSESFSIPMPANTDLIIVVYDMDGPGACDDYSIQVHGIRCPAPELTIQSGSAPDTVVIAWSTSYPGWILKQASKAGTTDPAEIRTVSETPVFVNNQYQVTLPSTAARSFFWLESP